MNNIYIPSYKRFERVRTFEYLGCGKIVVPKSQKLDYIKRYGNHVIAIPDKKDGSVSKKRNAILDLIEQEQKDGFGWVCDDDLVGIKRKKENKELSGEEALELLEKTYIKAKDINVTYAGFDYSEDKMKLKDYLPFSMNKPIFGISLIYANDNIRYDTRLKVNEDVEFWLQKINKCRKIFKDNQYCAVFFGHDGGKDSVIKYNRGEQKRYATMINNKWGYKAMVWERTKFRFYTPIKGA